MIGWSGSPSRKSTMTSWPTLGMWMTPQFLPAQSVPTRIQHELRAFLLPSRSQWNWTFTRPYLSVKISSPGGPTTTAVCDPATTGLGVTRGGRDGRANGTAGELLGEGKEASSPGGEVDPLRGGGGAAPGA